MGRADAGAKVEELTKRLESYRAEAQELEKRREALEEHDDTSSLESFDGEDADRLKLLRESLIPDCEEQLEYWSGQI